MTVETSTRKQSYAGGQGTLTFTFKALPDHPEYIKVKETLISTGVETDLTYNVDYTVSLESDGVGGVVTVSPTYSTSYTQTVYRSTTDTQESDYDDYNQFPADTLEEDLDRRTLISQENIEESGRTLKLSITTTLSTLTLPSPSAEAFIGWNSAGTAIENKTVASAGTIVLDTDGTLAANSDSKVATQKATKTYVDAVGTRVTAVSNAVIAIKRVAVLKVIQETDTLTTGDGQIYFPIPAELNGMNIISAEACIYTVSATQSSITLERGRRVSATTAPTYVDILSIPIYIEANEFDSVNATTRSTINLSYDDMVSSTYVDLIRVNIDTTGSGAKGLDVRLQFQTP